MRTLSVMAAASAALLTACVPPPPSPPPPVATPSAPATAARCSGASSAAAQSAPVEPQGLDRDDIVRAARVASAAATAVGWDEVTVVAVGDDARPELVSAAVDDATDVALATAQRHHVIAVEVPSVASILGEASASPSGSSDPMVSQQWAHHAYPFSQLWACGRGAGVDVAVVDTGVQATHPDLTGRVTPGVSIIAGVTVTGDGGLDENGHGTHVAGTVAAGDNGTGIVGVAPQATIIPVRVLDAAGLGLNSDIARGITWAVDNGAEVVNVSLGSSTNSASIETAVRYAVSHGVVVVGAAGNGGPTGAPQYPAALTDVIAVAAAASTGALASFSTNGSYVDVTGPGVSILSSYLVATWATMSGTSMASPHVAGLVALLIDARGSLAPAALQSALTTTATDAGPPGFDTGFGWGRIDPVAALNSL